MCTKYSKTDDKFIISRFNSVKLSFKKESLLVSQVLGGEALNNASLGKQRNVISA